jgi:hypothetical protein
MNPSNDVTRLLQMNPLTRVSCNRLLVRRPSRRFFSVVGGRSGGFGGEFSLLVPAPKSRSVANVDGVMAAQLPLVLECGPWREFFCLPV